MAVLAQLVERCLVKAVVTSSILVNRPSLPYVPKLLIFFSFFWLRQPSVFLTPSSLNRASQPLPSTKLQKVPAWWARDGGKVSNKGPSGHKKSMSAWCNGSHETLKMFCLIASQFESECGYKFCWPYGILRRSLLLRSNLRINKIYLRQKYPLLP